MIYRIRSQAPRLVWGLALGLGLCLSAAAEEHESPPPSAPAAKPSATGYAVERRPVIAQAPQLPRSKVSGVSAVQRVNPPSVTKSAPKSADGQITMTVAAVNVPAADTAAHALEWSYEGKTGPFQWARMGPEFAKCGSGERQSPIDIRDGMKVDLDPVIFEYRPSSFKVIDNGHTIQANINGWNAMRVMGRRFRLVQFHFHRPSEEMIDGQQFEMVVHLVHQDGEGRLAVIAVLVESGARQPIIQAVLNNLPLEKGEEIPASGNIDLMQLLPANRRYFTYMGSLTTPPCTEDVLWIVMKQPVQATEDQLNLFSRLYPMNARPIQATSGRVIKESN